MCGSQGGGREVVSVHPHSLVVHFRELSNTEDSYLKRHCGLYAVHYKIKMDYKSVKITNEAYF